MQSETLDTLKEGVAVFGTDGRLKFFNPAFASLLKLDANLLNDKPHIDRLADLCALFGENQSFFDEIISTVVTASAISAPASRGASPAATARCSIAPRSRCPTVRRY